MARSVVIVRYDLDTMGVIECDSPTTARALQTRLEEQLLSDFSVEVIDLEAKTASMGNLDEIVHYFTNDPD